MKPKEIVKKGAAGVGLAILSAAVLCSAVAVLIQHEMIPETAMQTTAMMIGAITVFLSDWIVVKKIPQSRLPVAIGMGAGYVILLSLLKLAIFPHAAFGRVWLFAVPIIASAFAGIIGSKKQKRRR